jgi:hypothetical protein
MYLKHVKSYFKALPCLCTSYGSSRLRCYSHFSSCHCRYAPEITSGAGPPSCVLPWHWCRMKIQVSWDVMPCRLVSSFHFSKDRSAVGFRVNSSKYCFALPGFLHSSGLHSYAYFRIVVSSLHVGIHNVAISFGSLTFIDDVLRIRFCF